MVPVHLDLESRKYLLANFTSQRSENKAVLSAVALYKHMSPHHGATSLMTH